MGKGKFTLVPRTLSILCCCVWLAGCAADRAAPVSELAAGRDYSEKNRASYKQSVYTVKKGDTLYSVSWVAGQDFRTLARLNKIKPPYTIHPGQKLRLKAASKPKPSKAKPKATTIAKSSPPKTPKSQSPQRVDRRTSKRYSEQTAKKSSAKKPANYPSKVSKWKWPHNGRVIESFSNRDHGNKGIDLSGRRSDRIRAAAAGKVVYAGSALKGFGNLIIIKHSEDYLTAYAHLSKFRVKEQQWVKAGQDIADMGSSGTDRVKLHFEVRYRGKSVNPTRYLPKR